MPGQNVAPTGDPLRVCERQPPKAVEMPSDPVSPD